MTAKQRLFVKHYLITLNAKDAAIKAGYSEKSADQLGFQLLQKHSVREAVQKAMDVRAEKLDLRAEDVVREIMHLAFARATDVMQWGPNGIGVIPSDDLPDRAKAAVAEVSESATKDGDILIKIKMHDKGSALDKLMRHLGQYHDKVEHTGKDGGPIEMQTTDLSGLNRQEKESLLAMLEKAEGAKQ